MPSPRAGSVPARGSLLKRSVSTMSLKRLSTTISPQPSPAKRERSATDKLKEFTDRVRRTSLTHSPGKLRKTQPI
jgi:hypothetical protein